MDVMLASSRSSSSSTAGETTGDDDDDDDDSCVSGVSGVDCGRCSVGDGDDGNGMTDDDSSDDERDANDDAENRHPPVRARTFAIPSTEATTVTRTDAANEESYNRLHKLHRVRRQKKGNEVSETHL